MLIKTPYKLIQRVPQLKIVNGEKMESDRVNCDPELIDFFMINWKRYCHKVFPQLS